MATFFCAVAYVAFTMATQEVVEMCAKKWGMTVEDAEIILRQRFADEGY